MTEHHLDVNWLAVASATVFSFGLRGLWYSPIAFGEAYSKEVQLQAKPDSILVPLVGTFLFDGLKAFAMAHMLKNTLKVATNLSSVTAGIHVGLVAFFGFILPTRIQSVFLGWNVDQAFWNPF